MALRRSKLKKAKNVMGFDLSPPDLSFGSLCEFYAPYALDFFGVEFLSKILQKEPNWMND